MTTASIAHTSLRLVAGCSVALLVAAGGGAFAHNGSDHDGDGSHGRCIACGGNSGSVSDSSNHYHHHHHHHPTMTVDGPPLHGPGSSHNPIVDHPVHGPGSSHNPIIVPVTTVRDHRQPPARPPRMSHADYMCRHGHLSYCSHVHDHRTPQGTQCLGDLC